MSERGQELQDAYACIAELWCSPQDVDMAEVRRRAEKVVVKLQGCDKKAAASLAQFLRHPVSEEEYVELFELDPQCPLYLGSHAFEEPKTCAQAGLSDRNDYMIELRGIYGHLGLSPNGKEMPDYLPLMVEFLSLSASSEDPVREKLVKDYILPYLPPIHSRLEQLNSPYVHLLNALERVLMMDLGQQEASHV